MSGPRVDPVTGTETTGHSWDGIEELNSPLPRWWLWIFYATVLWSLVYVVLYPAWPLISDSTKGTLGWSSRAELAEEIAMVEEGQADVRRALRETDPALVPGDPELHGFALNAGAAVFRSHCSQCHGAGAAGFTGYPNLLDDAWLWGGTVEDILFTVRHGIRNDEDPDARWSEMPSFGETLSDGEISVLAAHVRSLPSGLDPLSGQGGSLFAEHCSVCHGDDGKGDRLQGAPDLTDAISLYGDSEESVAQSIIVGPFGVMPPWGGRLSEEEIRAVALYVHALGGGEPAGTAADE